MIISQRFTNRAKYQILKMGMKRDKKDDEDGGGAGGGHPYSNLEKTSVLQEARYSEKRLLNPFVNFSILLLNLQNL